VRLTVVGSWFFIFPWIRAWQMDPFNDQQFLMADKNSERNAVRGRIPSNNQKEL